MWAFKSSPPGSCLSPKLWVKPPSLVGHPRSAPALQSPPPTAPGSGRSRSSGAWQRWLWAEGPLATTDVGHFQHIIQLWDTQSIPIFSCTYLKLVPQTLLIPGWPQVKQRLNLVIFNAAGTAAGSNGAHWQMAVQHLKKLGVCRRLASNPKGIFTLKLNSILGSRFFRILQRVSKNRWSPLSAVIVQCFSPRRLEHRFFVPDEVSFLAVFKSFQVAPRMEWSIQWWFGLVVGGLKSPLNAP